MHWFLRKHHINVLLLAVLALFSITGLPVAQDDEGPPSNIGLELLVEGLVSPVDLDQADDGSGRLFVVDRPGLIRIIDSEGQLIEEPFLDIQDRVVELRGGFDERGLLGLALHPDFANNGRFFVHYSAPLRDEAPDDWDHTAHISEFRVSSDNPNLADPESERILLAVDEPQFNHNAGDISFGPDGFLYIPLGDGGNADDVGLGHTEGIGNAQDLSNLLGSILRIDVDNGDPYGIPVDNPFVADDNALDEIWAYGFRNPWQMSYDEEYGWLVADVGQNVWEEVHIVTAGNNYGWNILEGSHCFNPNHPDYNLLDCAVEGANGDTLQTPIIEYNQPYGIAVVGGHIYRGNDLPSSFQGLYVFGDWSTSFGLPNGKLLLASPPPSDAPASMWRIHPMTITNTDSESMGEFLLAIEEDVNGELYALTSAMSGPTGETGKVWRLVAGN